MDHIANCFSAIFNAARAALYYTDLAQSKKVVPILSLLYKDGFIAGFEKRIGERSELPYLRIFLNSKHQAVKTRFRRVSKSSLRVYKRFIDLMRGLKNGDYLILSTTAGIKSLEQAMVLHVGGEVIGRRVIDI